MCLTLVLEGATNKSSPPPIIRFRTTNSLSRVCLTLVLEGGLGSPLEAGATHGAYRTSVSMGGVDEELVKKMVEAASSVDLHRGHPRFCPSSLGRPDREK